MIGYLLSGAKMSGALLLAALTGGLLGACTMNPATFDPEDGSVQATATIVGCFGYGTFPHTSETPTVTPSGTRRPTATPTRRPTLPPCRELPCPQYQKTPAPLHPPWPSPALTCSPRPDQPTLTPQPTIDSLHQPSMPLPPLPAVMGNTEPANIGMSVGVARAGGVALDPRTGQPWVIWSQLNSDPGHEMEGRVYVKTTAPQTGTWLTAHSVNLPGWYKIAKQGPDSAIAVGRDGRVHVVYSYKADANALPRIHYRSSSDQGLTWSDPPDWSMADGGERISSLAIAIDSANLPHILYTDNGCDPDNPCNAGRVHYLEQLLNGDWRIDIAPRGDAAHQIATALTISDQGDTSRTHVAYVENSRVYAIWKDGPDGTWSQAKLLVDGNAAPDGIPDYAPGFNGFLRVLSFARGESSWVYVWWSIYSTGRICFAASSDGGVTWGMEETVSYFPRFRYPTPTRGANAWGTVHNPAPFWDALHQRILVFYQYCDRSLGGPSDCFPVFTYGEPGVPGPQWAGYADFDHPPLRIAQSTYSARASFLSVAPTMYQDGTTWMIWTESNSVDELYTVRIATGTLLSPGNATP